MNLFKGKKDSRSDFFSILCLTLCMRIGGVPSLAHLTAPEASLSSIGETAASSSSNTASALHEALSNPAYQDETSQLMLKHILTSPMVNELSFQKETRTVQKPNLGDGIKIAGSEEPGFPKNALQLQLFGQEGGLEAANAKLAQGHLEIEQIKQKISTDTQGAIQRAERYSLAASQGHYAVITDNEADDLSYLAKSFHDGIIPKIVIAYGGFMELRYRAILKFIESACRDNNVPAEKVPKVYRGFPHFSTRQDRARGYDWLEGKNYFTDLERFQYIRESLAAEISFKNPDGTWKEDVFEDPRFKEGLDALGDMIDRNQYTAIASIASPGVVAYLIRKDPLRAKKIGVTMSSPYDYILNEKGAQFLDTYNSRQAMSLFNELLNSGVDFLGVGGGTAKTRGLRNLHDASLGRNGEKLYPDVGLEHLQEVVSPESPFEHFRIMYHAGHNFSMAKWGDWNEQFTKYFKYLQIETPTNPAMGKLVKTHQETLELQRIMQEEAASKASKAEGQAADAATSSQSGAIVEKGDNPPMGAIVQAPETGKVEQPEAAKWPLERLMNSLKMWYLYGHKVRWQGPSADLHALFPFDPFRKSVYGAVRYDVKISPPRLERNGKPGRERLAQFFLSADSNHFAITDMNFPVIVNGYQDFLNRKYEEMLKIRGQARLGLGQ